MKIIIFDPIGGASGDMILGSLIHMGCPLEILTQTWDALSLTESRTKALVSTTEKKVNGITALDLKFDFAPEHHHDHRTHKDIRNIITSSAIDEQTKDTSLKIFDCIARAEAEVHDMNVDEVHFHEVGALDSIFDISGIATALSWFKPDMIFSRKVPLGQGTTHSMHGIIPVPAPATVKILQGFPVQFTEIEAELTTPTGAAVLKTLSSSLQPPCDIVLTGVGYGCGDRSYKTWPNIFRSILAETKEVPDENVYMIETDIDDMSPEDWEHIQSRLFDHGALDASLTTRIMKRGRPAIGIKILSRSQDLDTLLRELLNQTSSIGARYYPVRRRIMPRKEYIIKTDYGEVRIKESITPDGRKRLKPEYRDLQKIAGESGKPIAELRSDIERLVLDK